LAEIGEKIAHLAEAIHGTSRRLHPAILDDLGLETALREECRTFQQNFKIPVEFTAENVPASIPKEVSLCLYRVAQEGLRNIGKHSAEAAQVRVLLMGGAEKRGTQKRRDAITLRIEDTGDGFDLDQALRKGGLGLISMEERVRLVGGELKVQSQPGQGTTVTAFVPLKQKAV
jgi:signal transduction histidine kinase